ncbi:MAG: hypothetical protein DCF16_03745 [Alphaproteobacteria bacterium]|nr:MAG: hypothetical protein DCF16_03745 [Alphaproteobacteria bacterium]
MATSAVAQTKRPQQPVETPVWDQLERFASEAEFQRYLQDFQRAANDRHRRDYGPSDGFAPPVPPPPPPSAPPPGAAAESSGIVVTGSAQPSSGEPSSITNTQTQGVDEGGIVKQIGRFLVVLQDGRLFVVDTRAGPEQNGLALANRTNVYRWRGQDTWFDEMLTSGNRVLIAGYSYRERASEITVLTLSDDGQLTREATYYISSNDYYDVENYATRLVNGNLVIYTPLDLSSINAMRPVQWPLVRRWIRDGDNRAVTTAGRPLFDAQDIYKPVQSLHQPTVHSVSVCPLGDVRAGDEFECRTTAFVGGGEREFFVSTSDIYLWVTPEPWDDGLPACTRAESLPATLYRVPLDNAPPTALFARGVPMNQLALDASGTEFRALLNQDTRDCGTSQRDDLSVSYFRAPFTAFGTRPRQAPQSSYTRTPSPGGRAYEVRYTQTHVVYGGRQSRTSSPPGENAEPLTARVVAVPLNRPRAATTLTAPHNIIRVERAGGDIVLTGYRTDAGLSVSLLDLNGRPRITQTQLLQNRYESEGRSHAFNALVRPEGDGIMGLPTVTRVKEGNRWHWRSGASDISYLTLSAAGQLADAGTLNADPNARDPSYQCEVSCVDWYGNTRALFIGNRVFGLSATELIEGALENGRVVERQRLNLSRPPA